MGTIGWVRAACFYSAIRASEQQKNKQTRMSNIENRSLVAIIQAFDNQIEKVKTLFTKYMQHAEPVPKKRA